MSTLSKLSNLIHNTLYAEMVSLPRGCNKSINLDRYYFCMFLNDFGYFDESYNPLGMY